MSEVVECDQFPGRLRDLCEGRAIDGRKPVSQSACDTFRTENGLPLITVEPYAATTTRSTTPQRYVEPGPTVSKIGTNLSTLFSERIGQVPCGDCKAEIQKLNGMTADEVLNNIENIAQRIVLNAKKSAKWWLKLSVKVVEKFGSELHIELIKDYLREACRMENVKAVNAAIVSE